MHDLSKLANRFFRVVIRKQSYLNVLYLLLSFPLGLTYFVFLVVGLSLGIGLAILWIGFIVLALVFGAWIGFMAFERVLTNAMLGEKIPPIRRPAPLNSGLWQRFKVLLTSRTTWLGFVYLLIKFPLGIFSFTVIVTFFASSLALVSSPLIYRFVVIDLGFLVVSNLGEAFLASLFGLLLWPVSLHLCNWIAWASGRFARVMLSPSGEKQEDFNAKAEAKTGEPASEDVGSIDTTADQHTAESEALSGEG